MAKVMQELTPQGEKIVENVAQRFDVSTGAVRTMLQALVNGNGTMAQFSHPEFGGSGQWMQGGMTMVGDMFNHALKAKVDGLCAELSALLASQPLFVQPSASSQSQRQSGHSGTSLSVPSAGAGNWWPAELGSASSTGAQSNIRYAVFPGTQRLAIETQGRVTVYDTLDHRISGVSQQQGGGASVTFTSQYGIVRVDDLPIVSVDGLAPAAGVPQEAPPGGKAPPETPTGDIFAKIEKLAELRQKQLLTDEEFASKKAELLSRI